MGIYSKTRDYFRRLIYLNSLQKRYKTELPKKPDFVQLELNTSLSPEVSIIIPFYNQFDYTYNCLRSIARQYPQVDIEVILIDDNSSEKIDFSLLKKIKIIKNEENLGFLRSVNKGISAAKGKYIYLLNNDTQVHAGFLDELIYVFENFENVGAVGSMLLNSDGSLQEAGSFFLSDKSPTQIANKKIYTPEINYIYQTDYCSGCSLMFERLNSENELNLFDENFVPAYFEDADLCFQLKYHQGKNIYYTPFSKVTHFNGVSYQNEDRKKNEHKSALFVTNHDRFKNKWQKELNTIKSKNKWERIEELYGDKQIIFFHERVPQYDNNSGELRLTEIIKTYKNLGYNVTLIAPKNTIKNRYNIFFQKLGVRLFYKYTAAADLRLFIRRFFNKAPLIWYSASEMCLKYFKFSKVHFPESKTIFDMIDIHHLRYQRALMVNPNNKKYKRRFKRYYKNEKKAAQLVDIVIPISEDEAIYMHTFTPGIKTLVISNIHYVKINIDSVPDFESRKDILFIGSTHHPNIDAVNFLKDDILPLVWHKYPDLKLNVIGDLKNSFTDPLHPNIILHGYIQDITPQFLTHKMMVAPLRYGAGVKGKIGQAFEYGLPVVTSSTGAEGMYLKHNKNALLADDAAEFAEHIIKLLSDKQTWQTLKGNSAESLKPFSIETLIEKIKAIEKL